mmetsp:Transcript_6827/g.9938  ORF Transcript_6827/g.9938 Transcript_6827/m.9938 type:complete len:434 (+) Transcript_6827:29-1330(+)
MAASNSLYQYQNIWRDMIAPWLPVEDLISLTSTCKSARDLLRGYTLMSTRIFLTERIRKWIKTSGVHLGRNVTVPPENEMHNICGMCFSKSGNLLIVTSDGFLSSWEPITWSCIGKAPVARGDFEIVAGEMHECCVEGYVSNICLLSDGRAATALTKGFVKVWNADTLEQEGVFQTGEDCPILCLDKNGNLVTGDEDGKIKVWNSNFECVVTRKDECHSVSAIILLESGYILTTCSYFNEFQLWDTETGAKKLGFKLPDEAFLEMDDDEAWCDERVCSLCPLFGGGFASGHASGRIRIWTSCCNLTFVCNSILVGNTFLRTRECGIFSLCQLPDGKLISGNAHSTMKIWNPVKGANHEFKCVRTLRSEFDETSCIAIVPNCLSIAYHCSAPGSFNYKHRDPIRSHFCITALDDLFALTEDDMVDFDSDEDYED